MTTNNDADTDRDAETDTDVPTPPMSTSEPDHDAAGPDEHTDEALPSLTPSVREFIHADRDHECELCGADGTDEDVDLEIHHRVRKADGGTDHPRNLLLICQSCHRRHHGNEQIDIPAQQPTDAKTNTPTEPEPSQPDQNGTDTDAEPLPPRSTPNGADQEIIAYIEGHGPTTTGELATALEYSKQYIRRQCWKLGGEQLIVPQCDDTWELKDRASDEKIQTGLPEDPKEAKRAGRDEMIRRMSAHGMAHTQIAEITGYSRSTIDIAVNRARALRLDDDDDDIKVDLATVATRLSALLEVIDQAQLQTGAATGSTAAD